MLALKNKIQDLIDNKTIEFDPPATPNVITAPMPKHGKGVNTVDDVTFITYVEDLTTPLTILKANLIKAGVFPGCSKNCSCCDQRENGCELLKKGV